MLTLSHWLPILLFLLANDCEQKLERSGVFSDAEKVIVVDIGDQKLGGRCDLHLKIKNATGRALALDVSASCGCTDLSTKSVSAKIDEEFVFEFNLKIPVRDESLGLHILFTESMSNEKYRVDVKGQAKSLFGSEQRVVSFKKENSWDSTVDLIENFQDEIVDDVKLVNSDAYKLKHRVGRSLQLHSVRHESEFIDDPIILIVKGKSGKETVLAIPVELHGPPKISPSVLTLRKDGDLYRIVLLVNGIEALKDKSRLHVVIENKQLEVQGKTEKVQARAERTYLIVALFSSEQIAKIQSDSEALVRVTCEEGDWTSKAKLSRFRQ